MNVGAEGGHLPDVFYTMQLDRYGSRYISLHKENEADPGRIVWALYSEKNGMLDSVIVDENGKLYKSVGGGAGGRIPPPLKENLKTRHNQGEAKKALNSPPFAPIVKISAAHTNNLVRHLRF